MKLLLFDLDGTVLRSVAGAPPFHAAMRDVFGVEVDLHAIRPDGKTDPLIIAELLALAGVEAELDPATLATFEERLRIHLSEALARRTTRFEPIPGAPTLVEAVARDPRFGLAVVTGNLAASARLKIASAGFDGYFAAGAFGSDDRVRARLPELARRRFHLETGVEVPPAACVVIGDTPLDHAAAVANGMPSVLVASGRTSLAELERCAPAATFADWSDAGAIHRTLAEL